MKLNETIKLKEDPVQGEMITEALRVSKSEMERSVKINQRDFRVGVEYEFHLNRGTVELTRADSNAGSAAQSMAEEELERRIRDSLTPLARITSFMMDVFDDGNDFVNALEGEEDGYSDLTPEQKLMKFAKTINSTKLGFQSVVLGDPIFEQGLDSDIVSGLKDLYNAPINAADYQQVIQFMRQNESMIESLLDELDNIGMGENWSMNLHRLVREVEDSDWYSDELDAEATAALDVLSDTMGGEDEGNVEYVRETLPRGLMSGIQSIELDSDSSVPDGAEVITKPLIPDDAFDFMNVMFEYIKEHGSTSMQTGLHINISHRSFTQGTPPDPLKIIALMDTDFFQDATNVKKHTKYPQRNHLVEQLTASISNPSTLRSIARGYLDNGLAGMEDMMKHVMVRGVKYRSVNWTHFLQNYDPATKRIEFRFFGPSSNVGYEDRYNEIVNDIKFILYVINAVANSSYKPEVYYRGLYRILDRAARRTSYSGFNEVLQDERKNL